MYCGWLQETPFVKKADGLSANDLIRAAKIVFAEFGLPKKIVSDTGLIFCVRQI